MSTIKLVVSDVDGTLLTPDKRITEATKAAVRKLNAAGICFTLVSSRPTVGMRFLIEPLALVLPFGSFNGSSIVDPQLRPIEHSTIPPAVAKSCLVVLEEFGTDIWLFSHDRWLIRDISGEYVGLEQRAIRHAPEAVADFAPYLEDVSKLVGASSDPARLRHCEEAMREAMGREVTAVRSQPFYLDVTPPGHDKGTFVEAMARRLGISTAAVATIGDMENDLPMFATSGLSFAMGDAADEIKSHASHITTSSEEDGFAAAIETVLKL
ncbi:MAG: Cof-type HAD-IIB family hydrolase [Bradyrhizobium sp.]|uniref:Cof-type HAD-IIB family hydrolase n=1 Tax=Bradyrhizobium sp. TaxID=376 RepID=UPI0035365BA0